MNCPLVSIAMATYNGEKYLREQLDSIYTQSYKHLEIIVTDDCSLDSTVKILKEYNEKYGLKYFINDKNIGFVKNFEKAISLCTGEYIALADQDDIWLPYKVESGVKQINKIEKKYGKSFPILFHTDLEIVDRNLNHIADSFFHYQKINPFISSNLEKLKYESAIMGCTAIFNRAALNFCLPFSEHALSHDWWLGLAVLKNKGINFYSKEKFIHYRLHSNNAVGAPKINFSFFFKKIRNFCKFYDRYKMMMKDLEVDISLLKLIIFRFGNLLKPPIQ